MAHPDFVDYVESERARQGISPTELARRAGIDQGIVSRVLNRERKASAETVIAIAHGLRRPHDEALKAAGYLPAVPEKDRPLVRRLAHLLNELSDEELEVREREILAQIELNEERARRNAASKRRAT